MSSLRAVLEEHVRDGSVPGIVGLVAHGQRVDASSRCCTSRAGNGCTTPAPTSTVDDLHAFARLLLGEGAAGSRRLLTPAAVRQMTTDHLTPAQREAGGLFTGGQGWGFGGSVDVERTAPSNVPATAGPAAPARRRTSSRPPAQPRTCSARWR